MPDARSKAAADLRLLAQDRRVQADCAADLLRTTRTAVREAHRAGISMTEIARLLEIDRSSLYRTYASATRAR